MCFRNESYHDWKNNPTGTHVHKWPGNKEKGDVGRKSHDKNNSFEPTKSDMKFIKKALKYNQEHQKWIAYDTEKIKKGFLVSNPMG